MFVQVVSYITGKNKNLNYRGTFNFWEVNWVSYWAVKSILIVDKIYLFAECKCSQTIWVVAIQAVAIQAVAIQAVDYITFSKPHLMVPKR